MENVQPITISPIQEEILPIADETVNEIPVEQLMPEEFQVANLNPTIDNTNVITPVIEDIQPEVVTPIQEVNLVQGVNNTTNNESSN